MYHLQCNTLLELTEKLSQVPDTEYTGQLATYLKNYLDV